MQRPWTEQDLAQHSGHDHRSKSLIQQACASLELGCRDLLQAARDLSATAAQLHQQTTLAGCQAQGQSAENGVEPVRSTCISSPDAQLDVTSVELSKTSRRPSRSKKPKGPTTSHHFQSGPLPTIASARWNASRVVLLDVQPSDAQEIRPPDLPFTLRPKIFGLIQERIRDSLYALVVQAILWNKTKGTAALPILWALLSRYPTPSMLADAHAADVEAVIRTLGLQRRRALTLIRMATVWVAFPPCASRRYARRDYPRPGCNRGVRDRELLEPDDEREGWEVGHLPGVGEYALDSYRIFGRDQLRQVGDEPDHEPEWKRLVPRDKELAPYVQWKWALEGWEYDCKTGIRTRYGDWQPPGSRNVSMHRTRA